MNAVIYSRFSTDRQTESSIADQVRICTEWATREGITVVRTFSDEGISGAAIGNRPGFIAMRAAGMAREFELLLVMDLSRLSRSQGDLAQTIDRLIFNGVRVVGVHDGFDTARDGHELVSGLSGIIGQQFRKMVSKKTYAALESRAKQKRPTGGKAYGYDSRGGVLEEQAKNIRVIFTRTAEGASCRTIAAELNALGVPSPGSAWNRSERRCTGWMGSAIRAMLLNERYRGRIIWNRSEWVKHPKWGNRVRRERPASEWITHQDEAQRIVPDDLWHAVQRRMRPMPDDARLKAGGKARYLLSGLLRCDVCGAHYVMSNAHLYECSSHVGGRACDNGVRVRRDHAEEVLLAPIRNGLLDPARVERMAKEMERYYAEQWRARQTRVAQAPRELQELDARLARLRERLKRGDPDMPPDELQAAIERAEGKRVEIAAAVPEGKVTYKLLSRLPQAAALYRKQIECGLDGDARAAGKARVLLRELFCGEIRLLPQPEGGLLARWNLQPAALLRGVGSIGSGGRI